MANALYTSYLQDRLEGNISWNGDNIKCALVQDNYVPDLDNHSFLSDVSTLLAQSPTFTGKTTTDGVADANDVTFTAVAGGSTASSLVIYKDTGVASTSPLIAYIDTATGLPVATNGGDIDVQWDNGPNKIFKG